MPYSEDGKEDKSMMHSGSKSSRACFLDVLRVMATCAVVLLHCITGVMDTTDMSVYPLEKTIFLVALDWITWCVPIFVMISGYLFLNPAKEIGFHRMVTKYCMRIVLALFLFGVPYACLELIVLERGFNSATVWKAVEMIMHGNGWSHMWYLYMILVLYFLTPAIKSVLRRIPDWGVYVILALLLIGSSILTFLGKLWGMESLPHLPDAGIYFFYYICGYVIVKRKWEIGKVGKGLLVTGCAVLCGGMTISRLMGDYTVQMAYNYPFTVALSILLFLLLACCEPSLQRYAKKWEKAGELCFAIYLVHPVFVNVLYKFLHITPLSFSIYYSLPIFFLLILALAGVTAWLLRRIPFLKKYVL